MRGDLRSAHPGKLVLRAPLPNPTATFHPGVGDTVAVVGYEGEGEYVWRWHGVTVGNNEGWETAADTTATWIAPINGTWWVQVINRHGKSAWIDGGHLLSDGFGGDDPGFTGSDGCA